MIWVSLSGVNDTADICTIRKMSPHVKTVLIGTSLMRSPDPVGLLRSFTSGVLLEAVCALFRVPVQHCSCLNNAQIEFPNR